jgi:NAD(P)H-hydrate epimerase
MIVKSFRTLVACQFYFAGSAFQSNYPTRAISSGLLSLAITSKSFATMKTPMMSFPKENDSMTYKSDVKKWDTDKVTFINSSVAKEIDNDLMFNSGSFALEQLMELAGLSVASAVHDYFMRTLSIDSVSKKILIFAGPGNNGGDGLVCARHLKHFGYEPTIIYHQNSKKILPQVFVNLVKQCNDLGIQILPDLPSNICEINQDIPTNGTLKDELTGHSNPNSLRGYDLIVDSLFGFSFQGPPRDPYSSMISNMKDTDIPVISVDIPSGWDVEQGDIHSTGFSPQAVVSLTAPKVCMKGYKGYHYIGGRFVPPSIIEKYGLSMPDYGFNTNQIVLAFNENLSKKYDDDLSVLFITASSEEEAKMISGALLEQGIVACVNLIPGVSSLYMWEGKMEESKEVIMMIKTRTSLVNEVSTQVKLLHSYDLPETIALPISGGSTSYLDWVKTSTKKN